MANRPPEPIHERHFWSPRSRIHRTLVPEARRIGIPRSGNLQERLERRLFHPSGLFDHMFDRLHDRDAHLRIKSRPTEPEVDGTVISRTRALELLVQRAHNVRDKLLEVFCAPGERQEFRPCAACTTAQDREWLEGRHEELRADGKEPAPWWVGAPECRDLLCPACWFQKIYDLIEYMRVVGMTKPASARYWVVQQAMPLCFGHSVLTGHPHQHSMGPFLSSFEASPRIRATLPPGGLYPTFASTEMLDELQKLARKVQITSWGDWRQHLEASTAISLFQDMHHPQFSSEWPTGLPHQYRLPYNVAHRLYADLAFTRVFPISRLPVDYGTDVWIYPEDREQQINYAPYRIDRAWTTEDQVTDPRCADYPLTMFTGIFCDWQEAAAAIISGNSTSSDGVGPDLLYDHMYNPWGLFSPHYALQELGDWIKDPLNHSAVRGSVAALFRLAGHQWYRSAEPPLEDLPDIQPVGVSRFVPRIRGRQADNYWVDEWISLKRKA